MESTIKVWIYFDKYGSYGHDVIVVQVGGEVGDVISNYHKMYYVHDLDFGTNLMDVITPYLTSDYEVVFVSKAK